MNFIYQAMFFLLNQLHTLVGNYGLAIIILTVLIRGVLWPLNSSQARSMKKMQELQPKIKALQEKYKDNPQKMQEAMMKFYGENSFNPMAGCLPLLVQLPIFIGLYGALSSPHFLAETVNEPFLFINNLSHTLQTHSGKPLDGTFNVQADDKFSTDKTVTLTMTDGKTQEQEVKNQNEAIAVKPQPILPGSTVTMTLNLPALGLSDDYRNLIQSAQVLVVDNKSHELERVTFNNNNGVLTQQVPTLKGTTQVNTDVLILILIYGLLTLGYQKVMSAGQKPAAPVSKDDPAAAMQGPMMKMMPMIFVVMLFFIPIPAGVMIYLVVTTALMLIQTLWVNFSEDRKKEGKAKPSDQVVDIKADRA